MTHISATLAHQASAFTDYSHEQRQILVRPILKSLKLQGNLTRFYSLKMSELVKGFSDPLNIFISGEIGDAIVSIRFYVFF